MGEEKRMNLRNLHRSQKLKIMYRNRNKGNLSMSQDYLKNEMRTEADESMEQDGGGMNSSLNNFKQRADGGRNFP